MGYLVTSLISRKKYLAESIVIVDGLPGCGKTLVSQLISSLKRVELLSYDFNIEDVCALYALEKITKDAAVNIIRMNVDLKLYNLMQGRDTNFRYSDLSSVFNNHETKKYFQRIFNEGDEKIPEIIAKTKPILNLATHNKLSYSEPIIEALKERCTIVEVVRHPIYMINQQTLNFERLLNNARNFDVQMNYLENEIPYFTKGWEDQFLQSNSIEKSIFFIQKLTNRNEKFKKSIKNNFNSKIITIPFEKIVLDPDPFLKKIATSLNTDLSNDSVKIMKSQNIPRKKVNDGIDLAIYRRCGWKPLSGATEQENINILFQEFAEEISSEASDVLSQLIEEYEENYWNSTN